MLHSQNKTNNNNVESLSGSLIDKTTLSRGIQLEDNRPSSVLQRRQNTPLLPNNTSQRTFQNLLPSEIKTQGIVQLFKDSDEDTAVEAEVIERIGLLALTDYKKTSSNSFTLPHPHGKSKTITISIKTMSPDQAHGDPVLLAGNGENSFVLYVSKGADNSGLSNTLRAALHQLSMHAAETPADLESVAKIDPSASSAPTKGERIIADEVPQQFQTKIAPAAVWKTLISWVPDLEAENLGPEFEKAAMDLAVGMKMTLSAATRLTIELCENWFTYNPDTWKLTGAGRILLDHLNTMIPQIIQRSEDDKKHRTQMAKNTSGDGEGEKDDDDKKIPSSDEEIKKIIQRKEKQWKDFESDYPKIAAILKTKEQELREEFVDAFDNKHSKQTKDNLEDFLKIPNDKDTKTKRSAKLDIIKKVTKSYRAKSILVEFMDYLKKDDDTIEFETDADYLKNPDSKPKSRPTKQAIDNAVEAKFISKPEAELMIKHLGFATAVRLISYYRKNNAAAAIRAIINQFVRYHDVLSTAHQAPPVNTHSAIIDTNIARLFFLTHHDPEQVTAKARAEEIFAQKGITNIRISNMVLAELSEFGSRIFERGDEATKKTGIKWLPLSIDKARDGASQTNPYAKDLEKLELAKVGGDKGAPDRQIIADVLHARREPGTKPQFISADKGILKHLFLELRANYNKNLNPVYEKKKNEKGKGVESMVNEYMTTKSTIPHFETGNGLQGEADIYPIDIEEHYDRTAPIPLSGTKKVDPLTKDEIENLIDATGEAAELLKKPIGSGDILKIKHLFKLISKNGHRAMIAGGAVRDFVKGEIPKDIDLTTDMDIDDLLIVLNADSEFKTVPKHVFRLPRMNLIKLGAGSKGEIDITCSGGGIVKDLSKEGLEKEISKRDFSMNTLFVDDTGKIHDPGGRGRVDATDNKLHSAASHFVGELAEKMPGYQEAGRVLKFMGRGYKVAPEQLDYIRMRILRLLYRASSDPTELNGLVEILDKARERTPTELIEIMKDLGFSDRTIRVLYPDAPRGHYSDQTPAYEHNISPSRLPNLAPEKILDTTPQVKVDTEHGKVYQYRMFVKSAKTNEQLMVDVDKSNHGLPGHWAYHYHVYRWIKNNWNKHATGMSASGEAGKPNVIGDKYHGPEPWTWHLNADDLALSDTEMVKELEKKLGGEIPVKLNVKILNIGGEIELHVDKVREIARKNQLSTLLMMIKNTIDRGKLPDKEDMSRFGMTSSGGERLRFDKQFWEVQDFLNNCGAAITFTTLAEKIRLFDLLNYAKEYSKEELRNAATWAMKKSIDPIVFTHYFEAYLALRKDKVDESEIDKSYDDIKASAPATRTTDITKPDDRPQERMKELKESAEKGTLHFESDSVEKYHYIKHQKDMNLAGVSPYTVTEYLKSAQDAVKNGKETISTEQIGTHSFTFIYSNIKVVVKINDLNQAFIATAFGLSKQEIEQEDSHFTLEKFGFGNEAEMESFKKTGEDPQGIIKRNLKNIESLLVLIRGDLGHAESGLRKLNAVQQRIKEVKDFIHRSKVGLSTEITESSLSRIDILEFLVLETGELLNYENHVNTIDNQIRKLELNIRLQQEEQIQVAAQIMAKQIQKKYSIHAVGVLETNYNQLTAEADVINEFKQKISGSDSSAKKQIKEINSRLEQIIVLRKVIALAVKIVKAKKPSLYSNTTASLLNRYNKLDLSIKADHENKTKLALTIKQKIMKSGEAAPLPEDFKGIKNGGNTCYLASVMQIITHTPEYRNAFDENRVQKHPRMAAMGRYIIQQIQSGKGVTVEEIVNFRTELINAGWLSRNFIEAPRQQDAALLLNFILEETQADMQITELDRWQTIPVSEPKVPRKTPLNLLNIPGLAVDGQIAMQQLIADFLNVPLINDNMTHTRSLIGELPPVLTIQLNRFSYDRILLAAFKLNQKVTASNTIQIPVSVTENSIEQFVTYDLTGFIVHLGASINFGHYVSYYLKNGQWYGANDAHVNPVTIQVVNEAAKEAYTFTYKKR